MGQHDTSSPKRPGSGQPTPLAPLLVFTAANSIGTGAVTNGIFFIAEHVHGFNTADNYALGILLGVSYIASALGVGPLLDRLGGGGRRAIAAMLLTLTAVCWIPTAALATTGTPQNWGIWAVTGLYGLATGGMWPIVESYLSGGRRGRELRRVTGHFNVAWALAVAATLWFMAPFLGSEAPPRTGLRVLEGLGLLHVLSLAVLIWFPSEPPRDDHAHQHRGVPKRDRARHPEVGDAYPELLAVSRWLLPLSYLTLSAMSPYLPVAFDRLGLGGVWLPAGDALPQFGLAWPVLAVSIWMIARVVVFVWLGRARAWHGRWWTPIGGMTMLLLGFGAIVLSTAVPLWAGRPMVLIGLPTFGVGMGMIYACALYYAMAVGDAEVHAGGMHEALIGAGYLIGPLIGWGVALASRQPDGAVGVGFEGRVVAVVAGICVIVAAGAFWRAVRARGGARV